MRPRPPFLKQIESLRLDAALSFGENAATTRASGATAVVGNFRNHNVERRIAEGPSDNIGRNEEQGGGANDAIPNVQRSPASLTAHVDGEPHPHISPSLTAHMRLHTPFSPTTGGESNHHGTRSTHSELHTPSANSMTTPDAFACSTVNTELNPSHFPSPSARAYDELPSPRGGVRAYDHFPSPSERAQGQLPSPFAIGGGAVVPYVTTVSPINHFDHHTAADGGEGGRHGECTDSFLRSVKKCIPCCCFCCSSAVEAVLGFFLPGIGAGIANAVNNLADVTAEVARATAIDVQTGIRQAVRTNSPLARTNPEIVRFIGGFEDGMVTATEMTRGLAVMAIHGQIPMLGSPLSRTAQVTAITMVNNVADVIRDAQIATCDAVAYGTAVVVDGTSRVVEEIKRFVDSRSNTPQNAIPLAIVEEITADNNNEEQDGGGGLNPEDQAPSVLRSLLLFMGQMHATGQDDTTTPASDSIDDSEDVEEIEDNEEEDAEATEIPPVMIRIGMTGPAAIDAVDLHPGTHHQILGADGSGSQFGTA